MKVGQFVEPNFNCNPLPSLSLELMNTKNSHIQISQRGHQTSPISRHTMGLCLCFFSVSACASFVSLSTLASFFLFCLCRFSYLCLSIFMFCADLFIFSFPNLILLILPLSLFLLYLCFTMCPVSVFVSFSVYVFFAKARPVLSVCFSAVTNSAVFCYHRLHFFPFLLFICVCVTVSLWGTAKFSWKWQLWVPILITLYQSSENLIGILCPMLFINWRRADV